MFLTSRRTESGAPSCIRPMAAFDAAERLIVLLFYFVLAVRVGVPSWQQGQWTNLLLLPTEGVVVFFLLFRRRTEQISPRWQDWLLAFAGTVAPLLVQPIMVKSGGAALVSMPIGASLFLMGIVIQVLAKLTLGRSFGCVPANRGLKLAGPYRFVRHPMYAGYFLSHLAFLLMNPTAGNLALYAVCYTFQIPRLLAEERLLSLDPAYRDYRQAVRYRLIPGVF